MATRPQSITPFQWRNRIMIKFLASDYWWNKKGISEIGGGRTISNETGSNIIETHLRADVALTANTQFQSLIDMTPIGGILESIQSMGSAVAGKALGGVGRYMQVETWKSTDPLSFSLDFHFDTDMNPKNDVFLPAIALMAFTVPEETKNNILKTPGPNILSLLKKSKNDKGLDSEESKGLTSRLSADTDARLVSVLIGGWLYLNEVVLLKADPTFSKDSTESGYPLWADVSCQFKTLKTTTLDLLVGMAEDAQSKGRGISLQSSVTQKYY